MRFMLLVFSILLGSSAIAQQSIKTEVTAVEEKGQNFEITITSDKKFYVGGNIHILNVGDKQYKYSKLDRTGKSITFFMPKADFLSLPVGSDIWMSYGDMTKGKSMASMDIKTMCEASPGKLWYLGKWDETILNK